jgi:26S proteasome regulatory subunit T2
MEEEFIQNQERLKPQEDRNEEERNKVDMIRGSPMLVGTLEEVIDDNHAIVSSSVGPQCYVTIMSFVDKDQIEPGCQVLLHIKVCCWNDAAVEMMLLLELQPRELQPC